jgi:endonuclease YncB( thermonuclease family)
LCPQATVFMTTEFRRIRVAASAWLIAAGWHIAPTLACPPEAVQTQAVAAVISGSTLNLDDGSQLRLSSLLPPSARDLPAPPPSWTLDEEARAALDRLVTSGAIRLSSADSFRDRYGRQVAHAYAGDGTWLQSALVDAGYARVSPLPGETLCIRELFAREAVARAKGAGLWAHPVYAVRQARQTRTLERLTGTFQIVEGWVSAIGTTRTELFLNFGRDWRWDFTAAVDLRSAEQRAEAVARLTQLKGRLVRVRGFIERRNGPFVAVATEDAVEALPEGSASGR